MQTVVRSLGRCGLVGLVIALVAALSAAPATAAPGGDLPVGSLLSRTGETPDVFAFAAYDVLRLATLAYLTTGGSPEVGAMRAALPRVADSYFGATGRTRLDAAGDRADGSFDFWGVREDDDGFEWVLVGRSQSD